MRNSVISATLLAAAAIFTLGPKAHAAPDTLAVGATAPTFTLPSQEDKNVSLADYKGKWVVLYFYPKDQTSGCTKEAHNFQRDQAKYTAANAVVLGVSLDTVESHKSFCTKDSLTFKLLADPDHKVIDQYGVPVKNFGVAKFASRETFLISPDGKVARVWDVKDIDNHSDEVLAAIKEGTK